MSHNRYIAGASIGLKSLSWLSIVQNSLIHTMHGIQSRTQVNPLTHVIDKSGIYRIDTVQSQTERKPQNCSIWGQECAIVVAKVITISSWHCSCWSCSFQTKTQIKLLLCSDWLGTFLLCHLKFTLVTGNPRNRPIILSHKNYTIMKTLSHFWKWSKCKSEGFATQQLQLMP